MCSLFQTLCLIYRPFYFILTGKNYSHITDKEIVLETYPGSQSKKKKKEVDI